MCSKCNDNDDDDYDDDDDDDDKLKLNSSNIGVCTGEWRENVRHRIRLDQKHPVVISA